MNTMRLGWTLLYFLWEGAAIAALYAAVRRLVKGANERYLLACATLLLMVAAPVATWCLTAPQDTAMAARDQSARVPAVAPVPLPAMVRLEVPAVRQTPALRWVVAVWLLGASLLSLRMLGGWIMAARLRRQQVRVAPEEWTLKVDKLRQQLGVLRSVGLRVSSRVQSPLALGAWRPLILVPVGMLAGLPAEQVEALLVHELAHIRRHDYLVNLLQSVAEALLFYHPAVWWVSGHIRAEREHCCDDAAVAISGDVVGYVNALAELAAGGTTPLAVAANGGSLSERIARLLGGPRPAARKRGGLLAAVLVAAASFSLLAQETPRPSFQVASVKRNTVVNLRRKAISPKPGGQLAAENAPLLLLIQNAYHVQAYQVVGGPNWIQTDGYDIEAKPDRPATVQESLLMLQSLLADRFKLSLHRETKQLPVFAMGGAKGSFHPPAPKDATCGDQDGPPLPGTVPCGKVRISISPAGLQMDGGNAPMAEFVRVLAVAFNRPVIDETAFAGKLDVHLVFTPDDNLQGLPMPVPDEPARATDPNKPNIFAALQEQMGLKLTPSKGPVEVLVIDHVERPTAN
ncbi:MAG TPA: M56 family metallopeptidase [Bryobacteraceae bacterium]|jgi:uncharacterized protein (TIGR03435 family)|nr:M56 family metallopeptidase [Bryobacteraceae bacterium]